MSISISYNRIYEQQHSYYKSSYVHTQQLYVTKYNSKTFTSKYNVNRTTTKTAHKLPQYYIKLIKKRVI